VTGGVRRYGELFLGALAVAAAVVAVTRREPQADGAGTGRSADRVVHPATVPDVDAADGLLSTIKTLALAVMGRMREHGTVMLAAGLSYYALLAIFPAAIAAVSIYGLVADPTQLERQITSLTSALPTETAQFLGRQIEMIVSSSSSSLTTATIISIFAALWSASAGTKAMITGVNLAYGVTETRSFLVLRLTALIVTLSAIVVGLGAVAGVGFIPQILDAVGLEEATAELISWLRWPFVLLVVVLGLGGLYKLAPNRPWRMTRWVNIGALIAAAIWVVATVGMSVYVNNFGAFGATYGALAGLIVLMLWFFVSGLIVLVGAEINSELEHRGPPS
jgi:membrane protein